MMNEKCAACIHCEVCGLIESEVAKGGACNFYEDGKRWRPIKTRPITEKEKEYFVTDAEFIYECDLPDDGETVLITDKWGNVETDVFCRDDGCYFEDNCGEDDVVAWMPLPEPYKAESEDKDTDKCTYKETGCGSCKRQLDCPMNADKAESEDEE